MASVAVAFAAGCSSDGEAPRVLETPPASTSTLARLAAALPAESDLTEGGDVAYCPSGTSCRSWTETSRNVGVQVSLEGRSPDQWTGARMTLSAVQHRDAEGATAEYETFVEAYADRVGEYAFESAPLDEDGHDLPGEKGTGAWEEWEVGEWTGATYSSSSVFTDGGETSAPQAQARAVLRTENLLLWCDRIAPGKETAASDAATACAEVMTAYVEALDLLPVEAGAPVVTTEHLAEALPPTEDFPEGSTLVLRCPVDTSCDGLSDTYDAALSMNVAGEGGDPGADQGLGIMASLEATADSAQASLHEARRAQVGDVDVEPTTEVPVGRTGTADITDLSIDGWQGAFHVFEGVQSTTTAAGDVRTSGPHLVVTSTVVRDRIVVTVRGTYPVEDRSRAEAEDDARAHLTSYLTRVDQLATESARTWAG